MNAPSNWCPEIVFVQVARESCFGRCANRQAITSTLSITGANKHKIRRYVARVTQATAGFRSQVVRRTDKSTCVRWHTTTCSSQQQNENRQICIYIYIFAWLVNVVLVTSESPSEVSVTMEAGRNSRTKQQDGAHTANLGSRSSILHILQLELRPSYCSCRTFV